MWRLVSSLTLVSMTLALPAAQQIDALNTPPPSTLQIGSDGVDVDRLIINIFQMRNVTKNETTSDDCVCVPHYKCKEGKVVENEIDVINIRSSGPCDSYLEVCCKPSDQQAAVTPPPNSRTGCGQRHAEGVGFRITGQTENEAQNGEFPWMVAILKQMTFNNQKFYIYICGGSLIHRQAVLTAAHCLNFSGNEQLILKVRVGEWDTETEKEMYPSQDRDVESVAIHQGFHTRTVHNDFAILILKTPVEYAQNVDVACLAEMNANFDGSRCFASGWGKNAFGKKGQYQTILKKIDLPIVPHATCENRIRNKIGKWNFALDNSFICAGGEPEKDTCEGDGGSPLVCPVPNDPTRYVQVGVVSWGLGCGEKGIPGVYASVASGREWIDDQMAFYDLDKSVYQYPN